jgi:hypothetical protein
MPIAQPALIERVAPLLPQTIPAAQPLGVYSGAISAPEYTAKPGAPGGGSPLWPV